MITFARVPVVPGSVAETFTGDELFPMENSVAATWYQALETTKQGDQYDGNQFTPYTLPLSEVKQTKVASIDNAATQTITGGFTSSALGSPYTYDSGTDDQANLVGAVTLGMDIEYACYDPSGVKDYRPHTAAQLKQVLGDGALVKLTALKKAMTLKGEVEMATTIDQVNAINW